MFSFILSFSCPCILSIFLHVLTTSVIYEFGLVMRL